MSPSHEVHTHWYGNPFRESLKMGYCYGVPSKLQRPNFLLFHTAQEFCRGKKGVITINIADKG